MLFDGKNAGLKGDELEKKWIGMTGNIPGKDVLRKRLAKIMAICVDFADEDVSCPFSL